MDQLLLRLKNLGGQRVLALALALFATLVFLGYLVLRVSHAPMRPLFSQLEPADSARILDRLKQLEIPYEIKGDGDIVLIPENQIAVARMELAQDGLPSGGGVGYEIFDKNDVFGSTASLMDINYLRALEGELAKSVKTIQGVASARIHLVLPKKELFTQEKTEPAASVVLKMRGMARLNPLQIQSIQYLIASAVPSLTIDRISIIDDRGTLLARGQEDPRFKGEGLSAQQETKTALEHKLSRSIESLLEKTLGPGKIRAEISADMDFDQITSTSVEYNPDGQVARSTSTSQEENAAEGSGNDTVSIQNALREENAGNSAGKNHSKNNHSEENTNFEISNVTKTYVKETGTLKRLSIAVLVDGIYVSKDGKETYTPRSEDDLKKITELVKTAIGFQEKRGDTLQVTNMQFMTPPEEHESQDFSSKAMRYLTPETINLALTIIFALLAIFLVIRPIIKNTFKSMNPDKSEKTSMDRLNPSGNEEELYDENGEKISFSDIEFQSSPMKKISEVIEKHPEEAISVLRGWIYADTR